MTFLRNVLHDLVEKKLWPVAIALVVALVAVPVVLGGGTSKTPAADAVATAANGPDNQGATASAAVVSLDQQAAGEVSRGGKGRNPFAQHHVPKPQDALSSALNTAKTLVTGGGSSTGSSDTSTSSGGSTPSSGGGTPSTGGTTTPAAKPKPKTDTSADSTYHVTLKFGEDGTEKTFDNVARLTPLPSSTNPFFVFLGLKEDGKTAVFLVSSDAVPSGDGVCKPSVDNCQTVELKDGDIEFFDLQTGTAGVVQYQLELTSIDKGKAKTKASAAKAHTRESQAGREYLRTVMAVQPDLLQGWDFSSQTGLLVDRTVPLTETDVAHLPPAVAAAAVGAAPEPAPEPAPVATDQPQG